MENIKLNCGLVRFMKHLLENYGELQRQKRCSNCILTYGVRDDISKRLNFNGLLYSINTNWGMCLRTYT